MRGLLSGRFALRDFVAGGLCQGVYDRELISGGNFCPTVNFGRNGLYLGVMFGGFWPRKLWFRGLCQEAYDRGPISGEGLLPV